MRRSVLAPLTAAAMLVGSLGAAAQGTIVAPASQPQQPPSGPGSNGACGVAQSTFDNRAAPGNPVHVFQPTGAAPATVAQGRCDDPKRPTVFIAHGLNLADPSSYGDMIRHLVSVGNIVVYPTYQVNDGEKSTIEQAYRTMDAGMVQAAETTPRIDTTRVGWWGHSMGGSMIPYLVQRGAARAWGKHAIWMNNVAMTFALLVGRDEIRIPARTQVLTLAFEHDQMADKRIGNEVFEALTVSAAKKRHATLNTDIHGQPPFLADHNAPSGGNGTGVDAVDFAVWRLHDVLQTCALSGGRTCGDYSSTGTWSDGTPVVPATVTQHPVDEGPHPAVLAECDGFYGQQLNQDRIHRCGPTHL